MAQGKRRVFVSLEKGEAYVCVPCAQPNEHNEQKTYFGAYRQVGESVPTCGNCERPLVPAAEANWRGAL